MPALPEIYVLCPVCEEVDLFSEREYNMGRRPFCTSCRKSRMVKGDPERIQEILRAFDPEDPSDV